MIPIKFTSAHNLTTICDALTYVNDVLARQVSLGDLAAEDRDEGVALHRVARPFRWELALRVFYQLRHDLANGTEAIRTAGTAGDERGRR